MAGKAGSRSGLRLRYGLLTKSLSAGVAEEVGDGVNGAQPLLRDALGAGENGVGNTKSVLAIVVVVVVLLVVVVVVVGVIASGNADAPDRNGCMAGRFGGARSKSS